MQVLRQNVRREFSASERPRPFQNGSGALDWRVIALTELRHVQREPQLGARGKNEWLYVIVANALLALERSLDVLAAATRPLEGVQRASGL